jgi:hypothetical protein
MVVRHRSAPISHGTLGIILCNLIEAFKGPHDQKLCNSANAQSKSMLAAREQEVPM